MEKAPDAFRTISEVAEELDVPQHVLRFWETRFGQIKPLKRGGGRRYYRRDDVDLLKGIKAYLYAEGYTIRGVQRLLKERGLKHVVEKGRGPVEAGAKMGVPGSAVEADEDMESGPAIREDWPQTSLDDEVTPPVPPSARSVEAQRPLLSSHAREDLQAALKILDDCQKILRAAMR